MAMSYNSALRFVSEIAPTLDNPTEFIKWAEDICSLLAHIYVLDYEDVTEELYVMVKEVQDYEDEDEDEDEE